MEEAAARSARVRYVSAVVGPVTSIEEESEDSKVAATSADPDFCTESLHPPRSTARALLFSLSSVLA